MYASCCVRGVSATVCFNRSNTMKQVGVPWIMALLLALLTVSPQSSRGRALLPRQSPVDLITCQAPLKTLPPLTLYTVGTDGVVGALFNDGRTVEFTFTESLPSLRGGPLGGPYTFQQFHFHWGEFDYWGSEHFVDGTSFSLECHLVFFDSKFKTLGEALDSNNTANPVAVVGILTTVTEKDNMLLKPIMDMVPKLTSPGNSEALNAAKALRWPLSAFKVNQQYFTYNGSLTTPPYAEKVIWILMKKPITVSHKQLEAFRTIRGDDGKLVLDNKRDVQPLLGRSVMRGTPVRP